MLDISRRCVKGRVLLGLWRVNQAVENVLPVVERLVGNDRHSDPA